MAALTVLLVTGTALAVDEDGLFELGDGFGTAGSADIQGSDQPGCDWSDLFDADPTPMEVAAAVTECGGVGGLFLVDGRSKGNVADETTFVKGSSKNDAPISSWQWAEGSSPTKDDLSNVYAFATLNELNELVVYVGLERLDPKGDSHIDLEFNQTPVTLDREPPCGEDGTAGPEDGPPCEFEGERTEGDLLVVMDFERGGALGVLEIRRWNGFAYEIVESVGGEGCNASDTACGFNNGGPIPGGAWPSYDSRGNEVQELDRNAFTELGVNVTQLLGSTPCFVGVQGKTRASSSYDSTLKDFTLGGFEICSFDITKEGSPDQPQPTLSKKTDPFIYRFSITNTGAGTLYLVSVVDSDLGDITEEARSIGPEAAEASIDGSGDLLGGTGDCDPLPPGGGCTFDIVKAIPDDADDPFQTSTEATYGTQPIQLDAAAEVLITVRDEAELDLNLFQPSVDVTKTGSTTGTAGEAAFYAIDIVNTGSADSPPLVNGTVVDTLLGDLLDPANPFVTSSTCTDVLPTGESCRIEAERVVQPDDPDPLPNTVTATYNPQDFPNVITDSDDHSVDLVYPGFSLSIEAMPTEGFPGDVITYEITVVNTGDVALNEIVVTDTLLGDLSDLFPDVIAPGETVTVTVQRTILETDPDPIVNTTTATYQVDGLTTQVTETAVFVIDRLIPCAKSPGFWKGGEGVPKWDDLATDTIAQTAGFETDTLFPWLDPSLAGTTYLGILELPAEGDVTRQLSFKYVAARLNQAAFGVRASTAALLDAIDDYLLRHPVGSDPQGAEADEGAALLADLNAYFAETGEDRCPPSDEF